MKLTRRKFVKNAVAGASLLAAPLSSVGSTQSSLQKTSVSKIGPGASPVKPNVVFILADDLGWGDLSCYGRPDYRTPNLDLLASQGTRFTDAYSASALCTPTRCGFHTGRYPARLKIGLTEPLKTTDNSVGLDPGHPTIASLLKGSGYDTALFGKWHLGFRPEWGPNAHGFDEFFGILAGAGDYFLHKNGLGQPDLYENLTAVERNGYLTDLLTERAVNYITQPARDRTKPFFMSLQYTAPHWPWQGPKGGELIKFSDQTIERVTMGGGGSLKLYAEMMRSLDEGVGRVMKALKGAGLDSNTLVIFTSDNGGERYSYEWPFSGQKGELLEGGIRVPAIVRWPGVVPVNRVTQQMAISMDWTATILAAAETSPAVAYPLDGNDLIPLIKGSGAVRDRTFFWRLGKQDALREGKWKYYRNGPERHLFDLSIDEREQADFSKTNPDIMRRLSSAFDKWNDQMLPRPK
jgi:arylsulfatase A-like enzyme